MKSGRDFTKKYLSLLLRYEISGSGLGISAVNQLMLDDFLGSAADGVHGLNP